MGYSSIRLEVTSHCNLNCEYCHNSEHSNKKDDMTTEEILELIRNIKQEYPINKILLTGGEPLVNKDICKIIKQITDLGIKADMVSNGTLLTENMVRELEQSGLKRIRISIDEIGENSSLRSSENPNELWNTAEMVQKVSGIEVCIHTVCSPSNVDNLFNVYKKVLEIGAARWRVFDLGYQGGITQNKSKFDFEVYYDTLIKSTRKILEHYISNDLTKVLDIEVNNIFRTTILKQEENTSVNIEEAFKSRLESSPCDYVTNHQLSIRSNGKGTLCQYFHNTIFDFKEHRFNISNAIANQKDVVENRILMKDLKYCSKCKYCLICNSGCRSRTEFLTGDITDADPGMCYLLPKICSEIIPILPQKTQKAYASFINSNGLEPKYTKRELVEFLRKRGY